MASEKDPNQDVLDQVDGILEKIEEVDQPDNDFLNSVYESVKSLGERVEKFGSCNDRQRAALASWEAAVDKFVENKRKRSR